jgi:hypothetical protein
MVSCNKTIIIDLTRIVNRICRRKTYGQSCCSKSLPAIDTYGQKLREVFSAWTETERSILLLTASSYSVVSNFAFARFKDPPTPTHGPRWGKRRLRAAVCRGTMHRSVFLYPASIIFEGALVNAATVNLFAFQCLPSQGMYWRLGIYFATNLV